jgi:hypothetical protein
MPFGTGDELKSSNGKKNLTAEQALVTKSCRRKNSTYPRKSPNNPKKSPYRASVELKGLSMLR